MTYEKVQPAQGPIHLLKLGNRGANTTLFGLYLPHGELQCAYNSITRGFNIDGIDVDTVERRNKIGQRLAECALSFAESLNARSVDASIISRECLEVMERVFGEESLTVHLAGTFSPEGQPYRYNANAKLKHIL